MKALVTGGAGFIGSHLVELLLQEKHEVVVLDNLQTGTLKNLESVKKSPLLHFHQVDIRDKNRVTPFFEGVDWVFHLAALAAVVPSIKYPEEYFAVNVAGTLSVLEASKLAGVKRFVYSASCSCYGMSLSLPLSEKVPISPQAPYALMKHMGEELVLHWEKMYYLKSISLRLFNVYGPRANASGPYGSVIGNFVNQKKLGKPLTIVGDGEQTRDFIYVTDVAKAFYKAAASGLSGEVFNVGSGSQTSIKTIAKILGTDVVYLPKREGELEHSLADTTKIKKILNWEPVISLDEGLASL